MKSSVQIIFKICFAFLFSVLCSTANFAQVFVSDSEDLQDYVNAASPGDIFIVPDGNYNDFESTFTGIGTADNPIVVKAETIGGVIL